MTPLSRKSELMTSLHRNNQAMTSLSRNYEITRKNLYSCPQRGSVKCDYIPDDTGISSLFLRHAMLSLCSGLARLPGCLKRMSEAFYMVCTTP